MVKELESYKQPAHKFKTSNGQVEKRMKRNRIFALEYLSNGGDAKEAAIKAGYSAKTAHVAGSRLLKDQRVQEFMKKHVEKTEQAAGATFEWKVKTLMDVVDKCMRGEEDKEGLFKHQGVIAAIAELNKMMGDYAPAKTESKNLNVNAEIEDVQRIMSEFKRDY
jgi:phage terminase small subunit